MSYVVSTAVKVGRDNDYDYTDDEDGWKTSLVGFPPFHRGVYYTYPPDSFIHLDTLTAEVGGT